MPLVWKAKCKPISLPALTEVKFRHESNPAKPHLGRFCLHSQHHNEIQHHLHFLKEPGRPPFSPLLCQIILLGLGLSGHSPTLSTVLHTLSPFWKVSAPDSRGNEVSASPEGTKASFLAHARKTPALDWHEGFSAQEGTSRTWVSLKPKAFPESWEGGWALPRPVSTGVAPSPTELIPDLGRLAGRRQAELLRSARSFLPLHRPAAKGGDSGTDLPLSLTGISQYRIPESNQPSF